MPPRCVWATVEAFHTCLLTHLQHSSLPHVVASHSPCHALPALSMAGPSHPSFSVLLRAAGL